MALKALPLEFTNRIIVSENGLTWDSLYASCGVWEAAGLDQKAQSSGVFAIKKELRDEKKFKQNCYFCTRNGHQMKDCWELKNLRKLQEQNNRNANAVELRDEGKINDSKPYKVLSIRVTELNSFKIKVKINGEIVSELIDTGSEISLINEEYLRCGKLQGCNFGVVAANGEPIVVKGIAKNVAIEYEGNLSRVNLAVCQKLNQSCILGRDTLKGLGIGLFKQREIKEAIQHEIIITEGGPIASPYRRYAWAEEEQIEKLVKDWLEKGIIRNSNSPWRSPIVLVPKKDGGVRLCNDFRALNKITKGDGYIFPWIEDILDTLAGAKIFSKMDAKSGYHQIDMKESDKEKTAFSCKLGTFEYNKMPFGLKNAPATFQRVMDNAFRDYLWKFVVVYMDDIIVFSQNEQEHSQHLRLVKQKLEEIKLVLNLEKCQYFRREIEVLGHWITEKGVSITPSRIKAIQNLKLPTTKTELQSFLGLINFCRKFIKNMSQLCSPLFKLIREDISGGDFKNKVTNMEYKELFQRIKEETCKGTVLTLPTRQGKFIVTTDASGIGVGAVLSQI